MKILKSAYLLSCLISLVYAHQICELLVKDGNPQTLQFLSQDLSPSQVSCLQSHGVEIDASSGEDTQMMVVEINDEGLSGLESQKLVLREKVPQILEFEPEGRALAEKVPGTRIFRNSKKTFKLKPGDYTIFYFEATKYPISPMNVKITLASPRKYTFQALDSTTETFNTVANDEFAKVFSTDYMKNHAEQHIKMSLVLDSSETVATTVTVEVSDKRTPAIIGAIFGSIGFLILAVPALLCYFGNKRRNKEKTTIHTIKSTPSANVQVTPHPAETPKPKE